MFEKRNVDFSKMIKEQQLFAVRNTNSSTLNLNISESNRARAELQAFRDDKNT